MGVFAAHRQGLCLCPQHNLSTSTTNGAVRNVTFNQIGAQAVGDQRYCLGKGGAVDTVIAGSGTVTVNGRSAVPCCKVVTEHGGTVLLGARNVTIGGPLIIGPYARFAKACHSAALGREGQHWVADNATKTVLPTNDYSYDPYKQGWGNCGPECARMLINGIAGKNLTEWQMLKWSLDEGLADWGSYQKRIGDTDPPKYETIKVPRQTTDKGLQDRQIHTDGDESGSPGGSNPGDWKQMTRKQGVETVDLSPNPSDQPVDECIAGSLREGKPVIFSTHPGWLAQDPKTGALQPDRTSPGFHVVLVTGYEAGPDGKPVAFYINDPALGCSIRVPAKHLASEQRRGYGLVCPKSAAW